MDVEEADVWKGAEWITRLGSIRLGHVHSMADCYWVSTMCQAWLQPLRITQWTAQVPRLQSGGSQPRAVLLPGDIWQCLKIVLLVTLRWYYWHLVSRSQRYCQISYNVYESLPQQIIVGPFPASVALVEWQAGASSWRTLQTRPKNVPVPFPDQVASCNQMWQQKSREQTLSVANDLPAQKTSVQLPQLFYYRPGMTCKWNSTTSGSELLRAYENIQPTKRDGFFLLNQIK